MEQRRDELRSGLIERAARDQTFWQGLVRDFKGAIWTWHEETRGAGRTATVTCTYRRRIGRVTATFAVRG